jgi:hypothetical protein
MNMLNAGVAAGVADLGAEQRSEVRDEQTTKMHPV